MLAAIFRAEGPSGRVGASTAHLACWGPIKAASVALIPIPYRAGFRQSRLESRALRWPTCGFPGIFGSPRLWRLFWAGLEPAGPRDKPSYQVSGPGCVFTAP
jgi:hypothetical protein